jgi:5-methylcytosine-specific restriction endonuclease McrA
MCKEPDCANEAVKYGRCLPHHRAKQNEYMMAYRRRDPEKERLRWRKYQAENREATKAASLAWSRRNKDHKAEYDREYWQRNRERKRNKTMVYQARQRGAVVRQVMIKELKRLYAQPCMWCGTTEDITMDHLIPLARGGEHSIGNLVACCRSCNSSKGNKLPVEFKWWRLNVLSRVVKQLA